MTDFSGVIDPTAAWSDVPNMTAEAVLMGGDGGSLNAQALALAARTKLLKQTTDTHGDDISLLQLQMGTAQSDITALAAAAGSAQSDIDDLNDSLLQTIFNAVYPVGTPYFNKTDNRNPAVILGFGTWAREEGRVLVGFHSGDPDFGTAGATGGAKTHTLTVPQLPPHSHPVSANIAGTGGGTNQNWYLADYDPDADYNFDSGDTGGGEAHNNLQPYVVYHWWVRTA